MRLDASKIFPLHFSKFGFGGMLPIQQMTREVFVFPFYSSYTWKKGVPVGVSRTEKQKGKTFRIVTDPYGVHTSLELYKDGEFLKTVYDSKVFNFKHLKEEYQHAWQKETLFETKTEKRCLIRNIEDRVVLIETYHFEKDHCKECVITSPHGMLLGREKISMKKLGDPENKVALFDALDNPVMEKHYLCDEQGEFIQVESVTWGATEP